MGSQHYDDIGSVGGIIWSQMGPTDGWPIVHETLRV
jgi:hypothetical protein